MSELDNFLAKTSQKNNIGGLDDFAKKYFAPVNTTPAENVNVSAGEAPTGTDVQPGILANAFRDIRNKVGQWWEGAKAGASEVVKAAQQMPVSMSSAEVPGGAGLTPADQSAIEYNQKAVGNFTNETIKPAAYTVGLAVPAAAAPFIVADAANIGKDQGVGAVAKEFSGYNAIAKAAENPLDVWMRFYNEPVTTAAELLPAFIVGRSGLKAAKGGLKSVREAIDTKASTALDKFLADTVPESAGKTTEQPTSVQGAIASQESGGNYNALNKDSGAAGKYQIMPENWPSWSEEAGLGRDAEMTPANQDRVAAFKMNQYSEMFGGDQRLVAAAWYAGPDYAKSLQEGKPLYNPNARFNGEGKVDPNGQYPSVNEYVDSVVGKMDNQGLRVASPDEVVAEETAAPAVKAKKDVDMTSIEADKILDDSKSNYGTPGKYDLSNIEKSPQNWYVSEYNNKGSDGVVGVVGVKGSPESYEIKDPATFKAIQEKFTENPNDEATMREIANNALANQDFTTAADMYEKLGSLQVAAQLRKVAKIHQTEQLNMVVPKETDTDAIRSEQQTPILARTAHDEQLQMANKAPEVEASAQSVTPVMKSEILKDIENLSPKYGLDG